MRIILWASILSGVVTGATESSPRATILDAYAFSGNSPVEMIDAGAVIKGKPAFTTNYLGFTYTFPSEASKKKFDANPDQYNIRLDGHCPVSLSHGQVHTGNPALYSMFDQRIFIFKDEAAKAAFDLEPSRYVARRGAATAASYTPSSGSTRPAG